MSTKQITEEIFDIVDQNDEVIGQKSRSEVHRLGLRDRSTHLLVFNQAGEVFLQKRSIHKDNNPGLWDSSVAGHVDQGESYDACVVREAQEEIGLKLYSTPDFLFKFEASAQTGWEFTQVYQTIAEGPFVLAKDEIETADWFGTEDVTDWLVKQPKAFPRSFQMIWQRWIGLKH